MIQSLANSIGVVRTCIQNLNRRVTALEAAIESERRHGNAAKMREALKELRDSARAFTHQIRNSKYSHILDKYTCRQQGFPAVLDLRETIPNANAALSAPATAEKSSAVGNAAAMREAIVKIAHYDDNDYGMDDPCCADGHICADIARKALSAPPRNCDVGTAKEQAKRLNEWCNGRHCINCQFKGGWPDECKLRWAQMPYEAKESEAAK